MNAALLLAGLAMGLAASPHCAAMCGAPCAALSGGCRRDAAGFQMGRLIGYMAGGAVAAGSVQALAVWSQSAPVLRPLWLMLQLTFLALGAWWLATGRPPRCMLRPVAVTVVLHRAGRRRRSIRAVLGGLAWVAWPCAALQGGLLLSSLAGSAIAGAAVMVAFALASMPGLMLAPWAWARWQAGRGAAVAPGKVSAWGYRIAGGGVVLASGWALSQGLWERMAAWCIAP